MIRQIIRESTQHDIETNGKANGNPRQPTDNTTDATGTQIARLQAVGFAARRERFNYSRQFRSSDRLSAERRMVSRCNAIAQG